MPGTPWSDPSWAPKAADLVVNIVDEVRRRTTRPLILLARGLVFGLVAGIAGIATAILLGVAAVRGVQAIIEWPLDHPRAVWVSYLLIGAVLLAVGAVLMVKRHSPENEVSS
jgi:hypothetical protein